MATPTTSPLGPYIAWMFGAGRAFDFFSAERQERPHYLTGIIERTGGHTPVVSLQPISGGGETAALLAPAMWSGLASPRFAPFVMSGPVVSGLTSASLAALWQNADGAGVTLPGGAGLGPMGGSTTRIGAGHPLRQDLVEASASGASSLSADPSVDASKPLIVVGIIDDGIPFAHRAFDGPNGKSRVDACWMQGQAPDGSGRVRFGREVTGADIDALRSAHGDDEDAIYRASQALGGGDDLPLSPLLADIAHGAHTLGALAEGGDANVRIIAVDLPPAITWDTSGYGKEMFMLAGLHYIFDRADKIAAAYGRSALPLVVNISYGYSGGAHDGAATLEAAMDELMEARRALAPTGFTMPAGNGFLESTHAEVTLTAGSTAEPLPLRVQPDDRTSSFLELWLPAGANASDIEMSVHGPGPTYGGTGPLLATLAGSAATPGKLSAIDVSVGGTVVGQLSADQARSGRWRFLLALAPTESAAGDAAQAGLWHIGLRDTRTSGPEQSLRLWIQRDISYGRGNTGARQMYFDEPENEIFDRQGRLLEEDTPGARVRRFGSLSGMATGSTSLVVGAGRIKKAEPYSAASLPGDPAQVDVSALISANEAVFGRLSLTTRSGPRVRMTGTSAAAPAVGAALRAEITGAQAGDEASNYRDTLSRAGRLDPVTLQDRLGAGRLE